MGEIIGWITENWVQLGVALWLLEQALRAISEITPWEFDDNIVKYLSRILKAIFPRKTNPSG